MAEIIIIKQTAATQTIFLIGVLLVSWALIGPGIYLRSAAMQWAGFLFLGFAAVARADGRPKMTIAEARAFLDKLEIEHD